MKTSEPQDNKRNADSQATLNGAADSRINQLIEANELRARELAGVRKRLTRIENHLNFPKVTVKITTEDLNPITDVDGEEHHLQPASRHELHPAVAQVLVDRGVARFLEEGG